MSPVCPSNTQTMAVTQASSHVAEAIDSSAWDSLPISLLTIIFDTVLRAPTPHPDYLEGKLESWVAISRTCKHWRHGIQETGVGVCLPKTISDKMQAFLRKARIRGLELHDPDHTDPRCYSLLCDPEMLRNSGEALQSIIDVPWDGSWQPAAFKNLSQLVIRRSTSTPGVSPVFDVSVVATMRHLKVLVLGSGFNGLQNLDQLPDCCKTLVVSCPGHPHDSYLEMPPWPANKELDWLSLSAHTLQVDLSLLKGHVRQLNVHTAYLFLESSSLGGKARRQTQAHRRQVAAAALEDIAEGLVSDPVLVELQLNCEVVMLGCRPDADALNTVLLSGGHEVDLTTYYSNVSNAQVEAALELASDRMQQGLGSRDRVQLTSMHHGEELEVTLMRIKHGEKNALALRLDLPGIDLRKEVACLLRQLADESSSTSGSSIGQSQGGAPGAAGAGAGLGGSGAVPAGASYRCVTFPAWSHLHYDSSAYQVQQPPASPPSAPPEQGTESAGAAVGPAQGTEGAASPSPLGAASDAAETLPTGIGSTNVAGPLAAQLGESSEGRGAHGGASATAAPAASLAALPEADQGSVSPASLSVAEMVELQTRLLSSSAFVEGSNSTLYEINGLLIPSDPRPTRLLLSPFCNLSALFATTMAELVPHREVLPMVLQELHLTAGTPRQRFSATAITNLTELRRMTLRGYYNYDLADMPAVRPGFGLGLLDPCPSRVMPLGCSTTDTLMPRGRIVDISINISSEPPPPAVPPPPAPPSASSSPLPPSPSSTSSTLPPTSSSSSSSLPSTSLAPAPSQQQHQHSSQQQQPAAHNSSTSAGASSGGSSSSSSSSVPPLAPPPPPQPLAVDITAWAPLGHGLHVNCDAGVYLHAPQATSLEQMMRHLADSGLDHFVVVTRLPPGVGHENFLNILTMPRLRTFKIILRNGRVIDGRRLLSLVSQKACPQWELSWHIVDGQHGAAAEGMAGGGGGGGGGAGVLGHDVNLADLQMLLPPGVLQFLDQNQLMELAAAAHNHAHGHAGGGGGSSSDEEQEEEEEGGPAQVPPPLGQGHAADRPVLCMAFHRKQPNDS